MPRRTTVELAPGVHRVRLAPADVMNAFLFVGDDGVTLVDTGLARSPRRITAALAEVGAEPADVRRIVLTHGHIDHAGGAARLLEVTGARLAAHERDAVYLRDGRPPHTDRSIRLARLLARLPQAGFAPAPVDDPLQDGELLDVAGGLRVVHTPGHTPGHVSLLHEPTGVLITGDAIFNVRRLRWPVAAFCTDFRLTQQTADRLGDLDFEVAAFTHGPEVRQEAREAVRAFLKGRPR